MSNIAAITHQEIEDRCLAVSRARQEKSEFNRQGGTNSTVC